MTNKKIKNFEDFEIWKRAAEIAIDIYKISDSDNLKNDFGSKDQIRRSACSISNNIAEGFEYNNNKEFIRFLKYAKGSSGELRSQLFILNKVGIVNELNYQKITKELLNISKQLSNFIKYLKEFEAKKTKTNL